ncbi:MAG: glycosyltransferase family 2 protein [Candidatus Dadabacteria bacterium]|nr:glycosyltransferase family 2 protein [Candidatus Dadabacteria bacterium]
MAVLPYFVFGPSTLMSIIGLIKGPDKTVPTPAEDWRDATVDVVIPALNEENNIPLCLASLARQTIKPKNIILVDDGSTDNTAKFAEHFCKLNGMDLLTIRRSAPIGKTPTIKRQSREFDSDVEFILDADTVLESENYIERTVQELYQAVGIASACGVILPLYDGDRNNLLASPPLRKFLAHEPTASIHPPLGWFDRIQGGITNLYRDALYNFLERFIYRGQMAFFGSITNPIGCAVAYRRKYVKDLFDHYEPLLGDDLTNSEDIFIGFAMINQGYRNIQLNDVFARSVEPEVRRLPKQIYMWSSSFFQCCYYFNDLLMSPFKAIKRYRQRKRIESDKSIQEKRKIQEPYRQAFGAEYTKKFGRPMGWIMLTSLIEKILFPLALLVMILLRWWEALLITVAAESVLSLLAILIISKKYSFESYVPAGGSNKKILRLRSEKGGRLEYLVKGILVIPIRYLSLMFDLYTMFHFAFQLWILRKRDWRK